MYGGGESLFARLSGPPSITVQRDILLMSGDNDVSLDEVMTHDKFNMAKLYDSQNGEYEQGDYAPFNNANFGTCEYY